ncbi:serine/threonine-protein kinase [Methanobacterium sp. BAmetb5]|uniref:serine/threonine-protein kinase n=1 Tax=Methanobacterium sp. BAmetb5 TaxID=2025351 RepID=UPI000E7EAB3A|nr:serine/threonine-protein kinase [Methanobacterium sp. BAmetb5]AXV38814.1 MAG: hypothetical protein CIT02_00075 [Methanobacterium sp. BAmetb5]
MVKNKFKEWKIGNSINQGGQGQIFLATNKNYEGKQFILKKLINIGRIARFKDEIKAGLELDHPNIIKVVDYDYENNSPFIVTEYYPIGTLEDFRLDKLTFEEKLVIFRKIVEAVAFAHENNVIHRDLKPENIFLNNKLEPVIGDFGLCFFSDDGNRVTITSEAVGSRYYMAPELADGRIDEVPYSADIYSLGKIFYWILTGVIFDREKHRAPNYDITKINPQREFFLINDFLDNMIVEDHNKRFTDAKHALKEFNSLNQRIRMGANLVDPDVPQTCIYCGSGQYKKVKYVKDGIIPMTAAEYYFNFRKLEEDNWTFLWCDKCNNIQFFHPLFKGETDKWKKKK